MNYNSKAHRDVVDKRRQTVASLRLRRLSEAEIVTALIELRQVNPNTNRPWSAGTVHGDLEALSIEWKASASADIGARQAELLAELDEVSRAAWRDKDLRTVLAAHKQKCDMLGLNAPTTLIAAMPTFIEKDFLADIDLDFATSQELDLIECTARVLDRMRQQTVEAQAMKNGGEKAPLAQLDS